MSRTHDLAEWASFLSLGVGVHASFSVFWFLLVDAHRSDFDPRPAVRRVIGAVRLAVESGAWDGQLNAVANVKHAARTAAHPSAEALRDAAALLLLLTTSPKGALR
ncbi:hypothetical protein [Streptomyces caniscabiei]|uniref:hypothetical protein n=1 Tax=Streptomyces caniscabiei TaxID=2746961 RepID=UPI0029B442A3|nr:hypothetical protein [Streptomyces caniscabiei]MDX2954541.1 hypothetical protein [Streptomyces caniscabiei]